jgi:hypothetical protein
VEDGVCAPYPTGQDLGTVRVTGVGPIAFEMTPIAGSYQPPASVSIPEPPFAEGAPITVRTGGGRLGVFTVSSPGVAPLELAGDFALASGQPLAVNWAAPAQAGQSRIAVKLDISHHGGSKGKIECDVADGGGLQIPASLISRLLALGVAGFPTIIVTREAVGTTALAQGRVTLRVTSTVEREVQVPGLQSCTEDAQCPAGQRCQEDLSCK